MKVLRKLLSASLIVMLTLSVMTTAFATTAVSIPSKPENSYIMDLANIVSEDIEADINQRNAQLAESKAEVFVVTINSTGEETIADFAKMIFTNWKIGGETENGVLFLINENTSGDTGPTYYALAGIGLNDTFGNDILKNLIKQEVEPEFSVGEYNVAVDTFVKVCVEEITGAESVLSGTDVPVNKDPSKNENDGGILGAIFGFFINLFLIILIVVVLAVIAFVLLNIRAQNIRKKRREARRGSARPSRSREISSKTRKRKVEDSVEEIVDNQPIEEDTTEE